MFTAELSLGVRQPQGVAGFNLTRQPTGADAVRQATYADAEKTALAGGRRQGIGAQRLFAIANADQRKLAGLIRVKNVADQV
ncbi:hypothetical protein D3C78_1435470 [compost metagenome]